MRFFRNRIPYPGQAKRDFALIGYLDYGSIMRYKHLTKIGDKCTINSDGTTKQEQRVDWAARNGAIFIKSAGNEGVNIINRNYNSITYLGTATNVISIGATNNWFVQDDDVLKNQRQNLRYH